MNNFNETGNNTSTKSVDEHHNTQFAQYTYNEMNNAKKKKKGFSAINVIMTIGILVIAFMCFIVGGFYNVLTAYEDMSDSSGVGELEARDAGENKAPNFIREYSDDFDYSHHDMLLARFTAYLENDQIDELVDELSEEDYDIDYYNDEEYPLIFTAVDLHKHDVIRMLVEEYDADINTYSDDEYVYLPINCAIDNDDMETVRLLVELGADIEKREEYGDTPLMLAVDSGYDVVKELVELGADPLSVDDDGWGLAHYAARGGTVQVYEYLVDECGADETLTTDMDYTVAHMSLLSGDLTMVEYLEKRGVEFTQPTSNGETLLHVVSSSELARHVLENYDCDVNAVDDYGWTPLHEATYSEFDPATIDMYMAKGAGSSVNTKNNDGNTPLFESVYNYNVAKTLIENGADVNLQNNSDQTVLMLAVQYEKIVELLIESGADINITDDEGYTAYDYALMHESEEYITQKTLDMLSGVTDVRASVI